MLFTTALQLKINYFLTLLYYELFVIAKNNVLLKI